MKKGLFKKIAVVSCCSILGLSGLLFAGCSKNEYKDTTETTTPTTVETVTNALQYEYSIALAKSVYSNALVNTKNQDAYKIESKRTLFSNYSVIDMVEESEAIFSNIDINGETKSVIKGEDSITTWIDTGNISTSKYYTFDLVNHKYQTTFTTKEVSGVNKECVALDFMLATELDISAGMGDSTIEGGRLLNDIEYIIFSINIGTVDRVVEIQIKNGLIHYVNVTDYIEGLVMGITNIKYSYENISLPQVPTSFAGYTLDESIGRYTYSAE